MAKHWQAMAIQSKYLSKVFPEPPLTAFRKQNYIRSMIIKYKVPEPPKLHEQRFMKGMAQCGIACPACPYKNRKSVRIDNNTTWQFNKKLSCQNYNIVYLITCEKRKMSKQ